MDTVTSSNQERPQLSRELTGKELLRWYWLKDELADFARLLNVRTAGGKEVLALRLAAVLDGVPFAGQCPNVRRARRSSQGC